MANNFSRLLVAALLASTLTTVEPPEDAVPIDEPTSALAPSATPAEPAVAEPPAEPTVEPSVEATTEPTPTSVPTQTPTPTLEQSQPMVRPLQIPPSKVTAEFLTISPGLLYATTTDGDLKRTAHTDGETMRTLPAGDVVQTTDIGYRDETGDTWWKVTQGSDQGWLRYADLIGIRKSQLSFAIKPDLNYYAKTTIQLLLIPSASSIAIKQIPSGAQVATTAERYGDFWKVRTGSRTGWVRNSDVQNSPVLNGVYASITSGLAYFTTTNTVLRLIPSDYGAVTASVPASDMVTTRARRFTTTTGEIWWEVTTQGKSGWVKYQNVSSLGQHRALTSVTAWLPYYTNISTPIYTLPSTQSSVKRTLACGTYARTTGKRFGDFWQMRAGPTTGWVRWADVSTVKKPELMVYGTLRSGEPAQHVFAGRTLSRAIDRVPQLELWLTFNNPLYGSWPWALNGSTGLTGEKLRFPSTTYNTEITRADKWEGYTPGGDPAKMNYTRDLTCTANRDHVWVYVATPWRDRQARNFGTKVPSGDFARY